MITHPLRAGGQFPPPHTDIFVGGISSIEPCTWGVTLDEAAWIWDKYEVTPTRPAAEASSSSADGTLIRSRSTSVRPRTIADHVPPVVGNCGLLRV